MTSVSLALLTVVTVGRAQFDFEKEVAGFFDFGKIPSEFTDPPSILNFYKSTTNSGNYLSSSSSTTAPPFTVFSSSITTNSIDDNEDVEKYNFEEHNEEGPLLPDFGEIQHNLTEKIDVNVTDDSEERGVKKRSYGSGHHGGQGGGGGYGGGGEHISSGYGGQGGGFSHGGGGYGGGGELAF